jgi:uncharacterized protein
MATNQETSAGPAQGTFCWNELLTRDKNKALDFYTKLLGWSTEQMDVGELGTYTVLKTGDRGIGGIIEMNGPSFEGVSSHWISYVAVDDIEATLSKAESLGAKVIEPINTIPNVGKIAIIEDPTGARIALYKSE